MRVFTGDVLFIPPKTHILDITLIRLINKVIQWSPVHFFFFFLLRRRHSPYADVRGFDGMHQMLPRGPGVSP